MSSEEHTDDVHQSDETSNKHKGPPVFLALFSIAAGIYPLLLSLNIIPDGVESLNVPVWVGVLASSIFIMAGLAMLARNIEWLSKLIVLAMIISFAVIGNWIAFGVGERTCGIEIFALTEEVSGLMCRIPFGYGAVLLNGLLLVMLLTTIAKRLVSGSISKVLDKISALIVGIILLPFLIFLIVPVIYKELKERLLKS